MWSLRLFSRSLFRDEKRFIVILGVRGLDQVSGLESDRDLGLG
jgi:hypothetical protein